MRLAECSLRRVMTVSTVILSAIVVTGCQSGSSTHSAPKHETIESDPNESFSSAEYGVAASPRITKNKIVRKGGGRVQVGKPYKVRGKWYYPKEELGYVKSGKASWYGSSFHGRLTANGEIYDMFGLSAAHPTFPLPSYARVTNLKTGSSVTVRVNDRGPYAHGRVMDMSSKAADLLGYKQEGVGDVKVEYVGLAPVDGDDTKMLMATYRPGNGARAIDDGLASGVMIASNDAPRSRIAMASAIAATRPQTLPGVRRLDAIAASTGSGPSTGSLYDTDGLSVGSIIDGATAIPTPRGNPFGSVVSSYAPANGAGAGSENAVAALSSIGRGPVGERIEIGLVTDQALLAAIRDIARDHGKLVVDAGAPDIEGSVSLSVEADADADVDALLQAIWQAGAPDAFVLRD